MNFVKTFIIAISLFFGQTAFGKIACDQHPIYCAIKKLKPSMDSERAMHLSNVIHTLSKQHGVNPYRAISILMQESGFENVNTYKVDRHEESKCNEKGCIKTITETQRAFDLSIAQINVKTAIHYGFDIERLYSLDETYAIQCFFVILKDKKQICDHLGNEAWSCYHSVTEKFRQKYVQSVNRHFDKVAPKLKTDVTLSN